jgi:hypothetical protein
MEEALRIPLSAEQAVKQETFNEAFYTRFDNSVDIATRQARPSPGDTRTAGSADDSMRRNTLSSQHRTRKLGRQDKPSSERTRNARTKSALRCYECEGRGHFASQCPTRLNKLSNSKSSPGRRRQNERSRRSHFPPDEASNRQQPVGEKESSSRLSGHIHVARNPGVPIFWNEDTPTIVAD